MKRGMLLALLALVSLLLAPAPRAHAADYTITNCNNDKQLRNKLTAIQSTGGSINFNCGTQPVTIRVKSILPAITTYATLDGGGLVTLSGNNQTRLFVVNPNATLTLYNITISNGYSDTDDGGAIYNAGRLNVTHSQFLRNQTGTNWSGGAIVNYGELNVTGSVFAHNRGGNAGAVYSRWGGSSTTIKKSKFHDNEVANKNGLGGAMLLWDGAGATVTSSKYINNTARDGGGAIYVTTNSSLTVSKSTFSGNKTRFAGGGVRVEQAATASFSRTRFIENSSQEHAGGIDNRGTLSLTDVILERNSADYEGGGLVLVSGAATLNRVTLSGNTARRGGGFESNTANATLTNVTLSGNSASQGGGGIYNVWGPITLNDVTLSGNSASNGGGIYHWSDDTKLTMYARNTIVANSTSGGNCYVELGSATPITSVGFNLSSDTTCSAYFNKGGDQNNKAARLNPLAKNGGFTQTFLPKTSPLSPAINNGSCTDRLGNPVTSDQRGKSRPQGAACEIGSVEVVE